MAAFAFLLAIYPWAAAPGCPAAAQSSPAQFCYQTDVVITNNTGGDLVDYPVRLLLNLAGMTAAGQLDPRGWDFKPVVGSYNNEISAVLQNIDSSNAAVWLIVPSIPAGESITARIYSANDSVQRDQGFYSRELLGADRVEADGTDPALDITDNLRIEMVINTAEDSSTTNTAYFLSKLAGASGYQVRKTSAGLGFDIENGSCNIAWDDGWSNKNTKFTTEYIAAAGIDTIIYVDDTPVASCDTDQGTLDVNDVPLMLLERHDLTQDSPRVTKLRSVRIWSAGSLVYSVQFRPQDMSETDSIGPVYGGTVQDLSGNGITTSYQLTADQDGIGVAVGTTTFVDLFDVPGAGEGFTEVGPPLPSDLADRALVSNGFLYRQVYVPVTDIAGSTGLAGEGLVFALLMAVAFVLGVLVWIPSKGFMPLVATVSGLPIGMGVGLGWINPLWLILWILAVGVSWAASLQLARP
jgi:hypothetical protein